MEHLKLVVVDRKYCDYLRGFDKRVAYTKSTRPFVGVLFKVNDFEYFAPLSSPKNKHLSMKNSIDFLKINRGIYGAVNFNNMMPITKDNYVVIDFDKKYITTDERQYKELLKNQLDWLNENYLQVLYKSKNLYKLYLEKRLSGNILARCCNFPLLEEKCQEYQTVLT